MFFRNYYLNGGDYARLNHKEKGIFKYNIIYLYGKNIYCAFVTKLIYFFLNIMPYLALINFQVANISLSVNLNKIQVFFCFKLFLLNHIMSILVKKN